MSQRKYIVEVEGKDKCDCGCCEWVHLTTLHNVWSEPGEIVRNALKVLRDRGIQTAEIGKYLCDCGCSKPKLGLRLSYKPCGWSARVTV